MSFFLCPYESLRTRRGVRVAEAPASRMSELELQARIYAGEFGICWPGNDGESVEIVHFGIWNREPGPDFCGALVRINGVEKSGDIEVDPDVRDWDHHGHSRNSAFENVILHVFLRAGTARFFTRTPGNRVVTQVQLPGPGAANVRLDRAPRSVLAPEAAEVLIREAARYRLRRKADAFRRLEGLRGRADAMFQGIACGLGYKNNKIPFQLLAQRCGLNRAMQRDGEALLFGVAGFLEARDFDLGGEEVRGYLGGLWRTWWTIRDRETRMILPPRAWNFSALRPSNHPHRRAGALAVAARSFGAILRAAESGNAGTFIESLAGLSHPYWDWHASLARDRLPRRTAIIGGDRAVDLAINVFLPALGPDAGWAGLNALRGPAPNRRIVKAAEWLCGSVPPEFFHPAVTQQGLLQLAADFFPACPQKIWEDRSHGWTAAPVPANIRL